MNALDQQKCTPCQGGTEPLKGDAIRQRLHVVDPAWTVVDEHHLARTFTFRDFRTALDFVNRVGDVAEAEGHHPDIHLTYGRATVTLWTHKIDGLHDNDFILAAKIDRLQR